MDGNGLLWQTTWNCKEHWVRAWLSIFVDILAWTSSYSKSTCLSLQVDFSRLLTNILQSKHTRRWNFQHLFKSHFHQQEHCRCYCSFLFPFFFAPSSGSNGWFPSNQRVREFDAQGLTNLAQSLAKLEMTSKDVMLDALIQVRNEKRAPGYLIRKDPITFSDGAWGV